MRLNSFIYAFLFFFCLEACSSTFEIEKYADEVLERGIYPYKTLNSVQSHQSFAIWNDLAIFLRHDETRLVADVVYLAQDCCLASVELLYGKYYKPHANVCCFGNRKYSPESLAPMLYVSQWSYQSERGIMVYDFYLEDDIVKVRNVQYIMPSVSSDIIGAGSIDWVVDTDNNKLYAFAYKLAGRSTIEEGNEEIITEFDLPLVGDNDTVFLSNADIKGIWHLPTFNYSQDKCYHNGKIYIVSGGDEKRYAHMNKLRVFDTINGRLEEDWNIGSLGMGLKEPEGLSIYNNLLLMTYVKRSNILWKCVF